MELGRYQQKQRFSSSLPNLTAVEFHHVYIQKWYTRRWCNCPKAVVGTNQVNRRKAATSKHSKGLQLNFWYLVISIIPAVESLTNGFFCDITNLWRLNHSTPMSWCGSIASRMIRKVSLQLADFKFRTTAEGPGIHGWTKILPRRFAVRSKKRNCNFGIFSASSTCKLLVFTKFCRQIDVETDYLWIFLAPATDMWILCRSMNIQPLWSLFKLGPQVTRTFWLEQDWWFMAPCV